MGGKEISPCRALASKFNMMSRRLAIGFLILRDHDPAAVEAALSCVYTGNYACGRLDHPLDLHMHATVYTFGDIYEMDAVKTKAAEKFHQSCAKLEHRLPLMPTFYPSADLVETIRLVYTQTSDEDRALRNCCLHTFITRANPAFFDQPNCRSLIDDSPSFAHDVVEHLLTEPAIYRDVIRRILQLHWRLGADEESVRLSLLSRRNSRKGNI